MKFGQPDHGKNVVGCAGGAGSAAVALHRLHGGGNSAVGELGQLALWMAASLAGMVTAVLTARTPFFKSLMRSMGIGSPGAEGRKSVRKLKPGKQESLPMLAEAIVGSSKSAIASVFGPPRSAVVMHPVTVGGPDATFWQADTWYYPLPKSGPLAMAIEFHGDDARRVEFLRAPEL
jgi:hypothetical protein